MRIQLGSWRWRMRERRPLRKGPRISSSTSLLSRWPQLRLTLRKFMRRHRIKVSDRLGVATIGSRLCGSVLTTQSLF